MSNAKTVEKSRHDQLLDAEQKIQQASRDTVESIRIIGNELTRIEENELYEVLGKNDFQEYVEVCLRLDYRMARAWMRAATALTLLDKEKLQLPYNQSQVLELTKLKSPEMLVGVWRKILDFCDEKKKVVTFELVKDAVAAQRTKTNEYVTRARVTTPKPAKGIDIDLGDNGTEAPTSTFTEDGEKALNRIRRLCGDEIADAIRAENPKVQERDIIKWAEQDTEMVKTLAYWIVQKRWTLRKAMAYEESAINESTTVQELVDLARSRGGRAQVEFDDARLTVEIMA